MPPRGLLSEICGGRQWRPRSTATYTNQQVFPDVDVTRLSALYNPIAALAVRESCGIPGLGTALRAACPVCLARGTLCLTHGYDAWYDGSPHTRGKQKIGDYFRIEFQNGTPLHKLLHLCTDVHAETDVRVAFITCSSKQIIKPR